MIRSAFLSGAAIVSLVALHAAAAVKDPTTLPAYPGTLVGEAPPPDEPLSLWYRRPAGVWTEALPVGNGRQGAMLFGGIDQDILCLNDGTFWAGGPYNPVNSEALAALPQVRQLIWDQKFKDAATLVSDKVMAKPLKQMAYQPIGDLLLSFPVGGPVRNYRRDLYLTTAIARVQFSSAGTTFTRELFASYPDQVLVLRLTADRPGQVNVTLGMRSDQPRPQVTLQGDTLIMQGSNAASQGIDGALRFDARVRLLGQGGQLSPAGSTLALRNADSATLLFTSATSYKNYHDVTGDPAAQNAATISAASAKPFEALRQAHVADHQRLFNRVSLDLGSAAPPQPTDARIAGFAKGADPALAALYFQYGRFLLIASSRAGGQPANLQGVWNDLTQPPWGSKYTININTEMNYWPVNTAALGECAEPLLAMVEDLAASGARTARTMYNARGWVVHHNTDLWRATAPIDGPQYGMWPTGGAWLCNTLFDQYEFTRDPALLQRLYPLMKGSAEFFLDTLVEDPARHCLVTNPSLSPEHAHPFGTSLCAGPAMDMQILRDLFAHCAAASETLGVDAGFRAQVLAARARLAPNRVGAQGQLQEWLDDWDALPGVDQHHRHVSHLYGFYPGEDIPFRGGDDKLVAAVRKSLEIRGDEATGWGLAWRLNLWARLHDGPHAYMILNNLLTPARTAPNLFDLHPPFQIDGNFGGTSGIAEMLLQSTAPQGPTPAEIELLPALPPAWPVGKVQGLRARGGFEVSVAWDKAALTSATVKNPGPASTVQVRYRDRTTTLTLPAGATRTLTATLQLQ